MSLISGDSRYIARPAISEQRLSISPQGRVRFNIKTPWRNGTTHVEWDAVESIAKLAAMVAPARAARRNNRAVSTIQRLEPVLGTDVQTCVYSGGAVRIVASIEEPTATAPSSLTA